MVGAKPVSPNDATGLRDKQTAADARAAGVQDAEILSEMDARDSTFNRRLEKIMGQGEGPSGVSRTEVRAGKKDASGETMDVAFDFFDADIADVVRLFMELLKENYSLDPAVKGKVALHVNSKMTREDVWELFRGMLRFHGASTVLDGEVWRILPLASVPVAIDEEGILFDGGEGGRRRGQSVQMFRLEYLPVSEFSNVIKPYLSPGSMVYGHEQSGVVLVADYPHTMRKIEKLVQVFDVSAFAGLHMRVFSLKYVKAEDMLKELDSLSQSTLIKQQGRERVNYLALPRLNMIVAMTWNEANLPFIEEWVTELDREAPTITGVEHEENIFVYYVENGIAKNIAESLDGLFNGKKDSESAYRSLKKIEKEKEEDDGLPVGKKLADQARQTSDNIVDNTFDNTMKAQDREGPTGGGGSFAGKLRGQVSFVVDESTNSILVKCVGSDYRVIKGVIDKLDIFPRQVLIEVLIAEINLDETNKLGVEWQYIFDLSGSGAARLGNLSLTNLLTDGPLTDGMSYLIANTERFKAAIQASATDNNVQILSSPHVLASDNQKATIDIGQEVPVITSQTLKDDSTSTVTSTDQSVQYRNTGIILSVTPHINEKGLVRMEVSQEVSELSDKFIEGIPSPIFSKRKAETSLSVKDGQTIVIGGLIRQSRSDTYTGVPGLSRIPILRNLMGTESKGWANTELMLFITPHVIVHNEDSEFISRKFMERLDTVKGSFD